ncbi:hypothetical protein FRB96_001173 [Tulasnella sp. 330]|nr:hypothetical protein FRB96_001173 [Tulasnella sp. 330]KAG8877572.1 hypothetical protein FRB97_003324 [Tulasnella sp. 331]
MSDYPVDKKEPVQSDLPTYRLNNDAEELTVGGEAPARRVCFWKRFRRGGRCCRRGLDGEELPRKKKSLARKILRVLVVFVLFFGISGFFIAKQKMHCIIKSHPVTCVPLEDANGSLTLPLANQRTHIGLHQSLTAGDIHVTHSEAVEAGHVAFQFDLPKEINYTDDEETPEYFICSISGPKIVALGIHSKDREAKRIKATSTSVTLPKEELGQSRSMSFMGQRHKFGHKLFKKIFRKQIRKSIMEAIKAAEAAKWQKIEHADAE